MGTTTNQQGFIDGASAGLNTTKAAILLALSRSEGDLDTAELQAVTGLSRGQVSGCLARLLRGRYIEFGLGLSPGRGGVFCLEPRGGRWLLWAERTGLLEGLDS